MARDNNKKEANVDALRSKSSLVTYGVDTTLEDENDSIKNIIQQTIIDTKQKLGERTNGKPINYFNEINFGNAFSELFVDNKTADTGKKQISDSEDFKKFMEDNSNVDVNSLLMEESTRSLAFNNYRIIYKHIPECAQALNIYKDNIMSPDDYTKLIFNVHYEKAIDKELGDLVDARLDSLTEKYQLEEKADKIIGETLLLGEKYVAVLSLEDNLGAMLNDPILSKASTTLNESLIRQADEDLISTTILSENIDMKADEVEALNECLGISNDADKLNKKNSEKLVAKLINENVIVGSSKELLLERFKAEESKTISGTDIPDNVFGGKKKKENTKKKDKSLMYINGSAIRMLDSERVVELRIDDICYGYYYAEETGNTIPQSSYLGTTSGRDVKGAMSLAQNNTISSTSGGAYTPATSAASQLGVGEQKLKLISDLFLNAISKKIDKDFIRNNKKFKDFIYDLVRQDYIIKKGIKLTYFKPDEVIKFECDPVFRDITFFAKLYLAILTNNLLIKLGRAHDKRIFYVNVGADAQYEQAIQRVIEDIKTKDYKMEGLNDFNTLLNLNPGRFDDYFMPTVNGERPVEIETLAGMDVDMNNDFVEYLKNSMMSGMGVPRNLIDVTSEVDYARSISAMNSNFVRSVIRYQKKLTPSFTRLYQMLYKNEYRFVNDMDDTDSSVDISYIKVTFPSPATLSMTNITEQLQSADQYAEFVSQALIPTKTDGSTEDKRIELKTRVIKDQLPGIDWDKYEDIKKQLMLDLEEEKINNKQDPSVMPDDPMMGGNGMGY